MKVGDYVRTNDGYINKIKKVNQWNVLVDARDLFGEEINIANNEIVKSSPNIIDLIEVGDYVINQCGEIIVPTGGNIDELKDTWKIFKNIKSIVTKEQFESMEYKVGD
jgi:hypothetical protein